jgi:hypothetical protein
VIIFVRGKVHCKLLTSLDLNGSVSVSTIVSNQYSAKLQLGEHTSFHVMGTRVESTNVKNLVKSFENFELLGK